MLLFYNYLTNPFRGVNLNLTVHFPLLFLRGRQLGEGRKRVSLTASVQSQESDDKRDKSLYFQHLVDNPIIFPLLPVVAENGIRLEMVDPENCGVQTEFLRKNRRRFRIGTVKILSII